VSARPRVGILATGDRWHVQALARALQGMGCEAVACPVTRLAGRVPAGSACHPGAARDGTPRTAGGAIGTAGVDLEALDALLVRFIPPGSLDQIVFRVDALHVIHHRGIPVVNSPRAVERTVDKHWTSRCLSEAGVPTPATVVTERFDDALAAFRTLGDVVVKPLLGSGGRGIVRVTDEDLAYRVLRALEAQRSVFYLQEFIPHGRSDLRFLVAGGRVVAAGRRTGEGWKTNVAAGARMTAHRARPEEEELAVRAARAVGADYAGVDILEADHGGRLVVEVNGIPGWRALQRTTSVDIASEIATLATERITAPRAAEALRAP
jgi:RimK family alpha-L-glutamate ligase